MAPKAVKAKVLSMGLRARASKALLATTSLAGLALLSGAAQAVDDFGLRLSILTRDNGQPVMMDLNGPLGLTFIGLTILTTVTAILHVKGRQRWAARLAKQHAEIGELEARIEQAEIFMAGEPHVVVAWGSATGEPIIEGDVSLILQAGSPRRLLGFSQWLGTADAKKLDDAVNKLKLRGEGFSLALDTPAGKRVEIDGRAVTGRAVMRIREISGDRLERMKAEEKFGRLAGEMAALHGVLDAIPQPVWLRYPDGRLAWVNQAYAEAVECRHPNEAISKGIELIDRPVREKILTENTEKPFIGSFPAIMSGKRNMLTVVDARTEFGSGGIGIDASDKETLRLQLQAEMQAHVRTLNELPIAIAIFDQKKNLRFHNEAYQRLWGLDPTYLKTLPSDGEILDHLRADRKLPEQVDFRIWKQTLLDGYQKSDTNEHAWHLPDGRMLRVVASPTPDGGINYVYDDMTERMTLEARFKALSQVQNETIDNLKEGVAVFASDGRLKLGNAAFATIWKLHAEALQGSPHVTELISRCPLATSSETWQLVHAGLTGLSEQRNGFTHRETRSDGSVIDCTTAPLPNGDTLITFADMTDKVNAERFLEERNEALEASAKMKNAFINNVTFELRDPLQNVTMSAAILTDETTVGALTPKQRQYAEDAKRSAEALLAMMTEIFDLASLDAGILELELEVLDPQVEIVAVATALADRLSTAQVKLITQIDADAAAFPGDRQRVRQIIFHLVANAIRHTDAGKNITITCSRDKNFLVLGVQDEGVGIPEESITRIFERFERGSGQSDHRGVGLGLPLVRALVELHGGTVHLKSKPGTGTLVTCKFPLGKLGQSDAPVKAA